MIYNLGSINADLVYTVPHLPEPGETLTASSMHRELGGKGANQSVAVTRAGREVIHIGAVGSDGAWMVDDLLSYGVGTDHIAHVDGPSGHAIINVEPSGENMIVLIAGANEKQSLTLLQTALKSAKADDILLLQNETSLQTEAAALAKEAGMYVIYSAAPFDADAVQMVLPHTDLLVMNAVEAALLEKTLGKVQVRHMLITHGADGADWMEGDRITHVPSIPVTPVDTTGAGDCFLGYVAAGLDEGLSPDAVMNRAAAAAALMVQKTGTAAAIPSLAEVEAFRD